MCKIFIVDAIMGAGKTSMAINKMNEDVDGNYIFITPYLDEVSRIIKSCPDKKFSQPENKGKGKLESLHHLIGNKKNIASTHALFAHYSDYTKELLVANQYTLILDEVFQVLDIVPLSKDDLHTILEHHAHIEDNILIWDDLNYSGRFTDIKVMALNKCIVVYGESMLLWNFPVEIFKSFKEVYILTYMFESQQQRYYYDYYDVEYKYLGVKNDNGYYSMSSNTAMPEYVYTLKDRIHIVDEPKINAVGDDFYALSSTWFSRERGTRQKFLLKNLKKNMLNFYNNKTKTPSDQNMWTTFKDSQKALSGKGYTKGFVSVNARATNQYRHKTSLVYCANIFINPLIKQFFRTKDIEVLEEEYALSELVQWVWRSAIRDGKEITIYIPSSRMRGLLISWLDDLSKMKEVADGES
jgi:hypothetical protein